MEDDLLISFKSKFIKVAMTTKNEKVPEKIREFAMHLAVHINEGITPMRMVWIIQQGIEDLKDEKFGKDKAERACIVVNLKYFPILIDYIGDKDFAKDFRRCFEEEFCKPMPAITKEETAMR